MVDMDLDDTKVDTINKFKSLSKTSLKYGFQTHLMFACFDFTTFLIATVRYNPGIIIRVFNFSTITIINRWITRLSVIFTTFRT